MEIKSQYLQKYLHSIAIEQIAEEYRQNKYQVTLNEMLGEYETDLIARKGNEAIVIEVKTGKMTPDRKRHIAQLANYVRQLGNYKFLVAIATPPKEKKLESANIKDLLTNYMLNNLPLELQDINAHAQIQEVTNIEIDEISIYNNFTHVMGNGTVSVVLPYTLPDDCNTVNKSQYCETFPFEFEITLKFDETKHHLIISEVAKLKIDTMSYYEETA